ncbi:MAG: aldehyde dehydrogenase family protein [Nocardioides sp.]|uniref:aldehyde dehydrogenase family protein n=1 Tax=Nocardioides sp. TaxID=35761 RepID=UPI0039E4217E
MTIQDAGARVGAEDLSALVAQLRTTYAAGRTRPVSWRLAQLDGLERLVDERESEIAEAIGHDLGRNAFDSWFGEIVGLKGEIAETRKHLTRWMKPRRHPIPLLQQPGSAWVQYEPLGVVLVIGPWNYPLLLALSPLLAAVSAGNAVVVKPSELAPATSALLARLVPEYLDAEAIKVVEGDGAVTQELLAQGFDHAFFTGGTEIGRKIMAGAAATLTPVTLELGGKSPVIVAADADLDVVARRLAWVKLMNSGQTCIAPDYVLVERPVRDELVRRVVATIEEMRASEAGTQQKIVNTRQWERLVGYLESTKGSVVRGGGHDAEAVTIEPTVVVDPDRHEPLMAEEIFGPILPIVTVDSLDEAVAHVNSGTKPLGLYVFSRSKARAKRVIDRIPAGGAVINHVALHFLIPSLPFGGVGASGIGAYHGAYGFQTFSHRKSVLAKPSRPDLRFIYPPYTERTKRLMRRMF